MILPIILGVLAGIAIGFLIFKSMEKSKGKKMLDGTRKEAATILKEAKIDAESVKKDKILQAKEKFIELKSEHEKVILSREKKMSDVEKRIRDRESKVASEVDKNKRLNQSLESKEKDYNFKLDFLEKKEGDLDKMHKRHVDMLEQISGLSADEAKKELVSSLKDEAHAEMSRTLVVGTKDLIKIDRDYFTPYQEYVVIIASEDRVFVSNVLTSLNQLRNENLLTFATPEIMKFNHIEQKYLSNLNVHYPQFGSIDYKSMQVKKFIEAYRAKHGHEPGERFAYIGYDVTNFVLGQLYSKGKLDIKKMDRKQYSKLLIDFVQPEHDGQKFGYINQGISIYKFTEGGKKKMYPFK